MRIISPGYINTANCQCPKNIRVPGRLYECSPNDITLSQKSGTYYYSIRGSGIRILSTQDIFRNFLEEYGADNQSQIPQIPQNTEVGELPTNFKIYTNEDEPDCIICYSNKKELVYVPCGHYITCIACDNNIKKRVCPMCKTTINNITTPDMIN
jgi:hypothetical protein